MLLLLLLLSLLLAGVANNLAHDKVLQLAQGGGDGRATRPLPCRSSNEVTVGVFAAHPTR